MNGNKLTVILTTFATTLAFLVLFHMPAIKKESPSQPNQPVVPEKPPITPPKPRPGDQVIWTEFKPIKSLSDPSWGTVLTDIENHLPPSMGTQYRHSDKNTWAHETTHGIHAHLNIIHKRSGDNVYCLYALNNKVAIIKQPKIKIAQIAEMIPQPLRKSRYQLYLVQQRRDWNNDPIYICDEWIAYVNGAACSVELYQKGMMQKENKSDALWSVVEFSVYALYVCMTAEKYDPSYDMKQLREVTASEVRRAMELYHAGMKFPNMNWDNNKYLQELQTGHGAKELREYTIKTFGEAWAKEVLGFTHLN